MQKEDIHCSAAILLVIKYLFFYFKIIILNKHFILLTEKSTGSITKHKGACLDVSAA